MRIPSIEKVAFVLSVAVFAFLYGVGTQAFGIFPSPLLERAWDQAKTIYPLSTIMAANSDTAPGWLTSRVYDRSGVRIVEPDKIQPGLTLFSSGWSSNDGPTSEVRLINREGSILHKWRVKPDELFPDTTDSPARPLSQLGAGAQYLFPNGDILVTISYVGALRLDACGDVVWHNTKYNFHHSIERHTDGTFWMPGLKRSLPAQSRNYPNGYPGLEGPIHRSLLVNVSAAGKVIDTINVIDVLYQNGLQRHLPLAMLDWNGELLEWADVIHMNDVEPLPDTLANEYPRFEAGDLVVSLRNPNLVFVVDPNSHKVKWHASEPFIDQHDPDFIGEGRIGVFDNNRDGTSRGEMLGGSRIVLLQPHTDSVSIPFPTSKSEPFYTPISGSWEMLRNGNFLLIESMAGRMVEVSPDGETVWEWIHEPYDKSRVPTIGKATRVAIDNNKVASWPCSPDDSTSEDTRAES